MTTESDLGAISKLLGDAFNSGDVNTLAFDLFQPVYRDFGPAMTRAQKIEAIVLYAEQNGRILDLLAYVQQKNPYQYNRYATQLQTALQSQSHSSPGASAAPSVTTDQSGTIPSTSASTQSASTQESPPTTVSQPATTSASNAPRLASENDSRLLMSAVVAVLVIMVVSAAVLRYILNVTEVSNLILLLLIELPFVLVIIGKLTGQDFLNWLSKLSKSE